MASELYLTEYERERQKKIEENKRLLETLGIFETRSVLDASTLSVDEAKPKRNYIKRARVQLEPRRSERVSIRPQTASYAESDDSGTESDKPKGKGVQGMGVRKLNSYFSVRKTMWKPFYGQEIATCHICLVRNRQPKTKCSRCYADFWRGHVCRGCYEANFTGEDIESFDEARENPNWVCFVCRGICTCKFCRVGSTKRGKRYTKKRPMEEEEALALAQGQQLQIKEERGTWDSDDGQSPFLQRKRGRGRPPKSRNGDPNQSLLMGSDPGDEEDQFDPLFEGQLDEHYQFDQLEQLEQLKEQLSQLEQLDQLQELERVEREHEMMRQDHQLGMVQDPTQHADALAQHMHAGHIMPQVPLKRGRGRPPKNPQQQQFKRQKYHKHELHHKLHQKGGRRKSLNEYSDVLEDKHHDVHVKQEPLMDDSLLGHDPSLLQYDQMLMLPEQPMLHEHILQDIPPLQEHSLQLPMLHGQSLQDISQEHGIQDQLFREHSFQQPFHNSFIHHSTHHSHHNHTHTHTNPLSMSAPAYTSHESFVPHTPSHFSLNNHHNHTHHNPNSILNSTTPTSLLLDNSLYQHPYFFQHYYYPSSSQQNQQDLQELQQQQQMQQEQQQQEIHRQEIHRQEIQRQRQELHRQELHREAAHRQEEEDLITRQHELRQLSTHHHAHHHPLLHTDFINQGSEPEHRAENSTQRDILHPASILQDPSTNDDAYHHFSSQPSSLMPPYESAQREHSPHHTDSHADYLAQIHEQDSPSSQQNTTLPPLPGLSLASLSPSPSLSSPSLPSLPSLSSPLELQQQFKQEYTHHDLQQREHYEPRNHSDH